VACVDETLELVVLKKDSTSYFVVLEMFQAGRSLTTFF
jgi:hypothetical protein